MIYKKGGIKGLPGCGQDNRPTHEFRYEFMGNGQYRVILNDVVSAATMGRIVRLISAEKAARRLAYENSAGTANCKTPALKTAKPTCSDD